MNPRENPVMANWYLFDTREEMVTGLKAAIISKLSAAVGQGRRASWAVSGGATPTPLFAAMQTAQLEWDKIDIALVDERWVSFDHPRSNEAFVAGGLLGGVAASAQLTGMKTGHTHAAEAVDDVNL
jgi:6-phosphogluconolactonase